MTAAPARKKITGGGRIKIARTGVRRAGGKRASGQPKAKVRRAKPSIRAAKIAYKQKRAMNSEKKTRKRAREASPVESMFPVAESPKRVEVGRPVPPPEPPKPLLRESRATSAALMLLEKGIKLLYQKDFKKARAEFKSLLETYPGEAEIRARGRSYMQICDREEASHRRPTVTNDQLYALGVMEHNRGNFEAAIAHFRHALVQHREAEYIYYSLAASFARKGNEAEAIQALRKAIELNEDNRVYSKNDSDFSSLHTNRDFTDLVGLAPHVAGAHSHS